MVPPLCRRDSDKRPCLDNSGGLRRAQIMYHLGLTMSDKRGKQPSVFSPAIGYSQPRLLCSDWLHWVRNTLLNFPVKDRAHNIRLHNRTNFSREISHVQYTSNLKLLDLKKISNHY
ncbi:hypothetical protein ElyMa_003805000 [Elysia marginata]|uniref:Uncharacterized protein n=1 Tax=Elysia marginata TaxID=1093978 RepID=A0AAV4FE48_9GAST|nr:hypothetical protein ElyMa_003805000 [Elysia marginata]